MHRHGRCSICGLSEAGSRGERRRAQQQQIAQTTRQLAPATHGRTRRTRDHGYRRAERSVRRGNHLDRKAHRLCERHWHWNSAFETVTKAFKTLRGFVDKEGLKSYGLPITVFTSTDDKGFQFEAALALAEPPKSAPRGDIAVGTSPQGHALKFVHRGSYDGLDHTYEAITKFLADTRLEAKDMFIEQ